MGKELLEAEWQKDDEIVSQDVREQAERLEELLGDILRDYDEAENDINFLLEQDQELLEEFVDMTAMLSLMEVSEEMNDVNAVEDACLNLIDKAFQLSKIIHPLSEMGKNRLAAGLYYSDLFEKKYRPLLTRVTKNNIAKFRPLLSEVDYDDIMIGEKNCLGALRYEDGQAYAAGIAVYHFDIAPVTDAPILRIDDVYVQDEFRGHGVGNFLMGHLLNYAAKYPDCVMTVAFRPIDDPNPREQETETVRNHYLDSWKFDFTLNLGKDYFLKLSDLKDNDAFKKLKSEAISLKDLGKDAEPLLKRFFRDLKSEEDMVYLNRPSDFYDRETSCAIVEKNGIKSLLLIHRYKKGNCRIEFIRSLPDSDSSHIPSLLNYAYHAYKGKGSEDAMVFGSFTGEEDRDALLELVPTAKVMLTYEGMLHIPDSRENITTEQWMELRREAGLKSPLPEDFDAEAVFTEEAAAQIDKAFARMSELME